MAIAKKIPRTTSHNYGRLANYIDGAEDKSEKLHKGFADYGLRLKKCANGLVITDLEGKRAVKASDIDRKLSKVALERNIGERSRQSRSE